MRLSRTEIIFGPTSIKFSAPEIWVLGKLRLFGIIGPQTDTTPTDHVHDWHNRSHHIHHWLN